MASGYLFRSPVHTSQNYVANRGYIHPQPCGFFENLPRDMWIIRTEDRFQMLIRHAECQPSNGTVRRVDRPDDETRFAVAYSAAPDPELRNMLARIYNKHGEVTLQHDGRDSTGKHWIKCLSRVRVGSLDRSVEKAVICVFSKFELATVTNLRMREEAAKNAKAKAKAEAKAKAAREKKERQPKVRDASALAREQFSSLPVKRKIPFVDPAAAKASREKMEREGLSGSSVMRAEAVAEAQRARSGSKEIRS